MKTKEQLVHFASTGPKFPYAYYIGVMTALKVYGEKVRLWITEKPESKYFDALKGRVRINEILAKDIPDFPGLRNLSDKSKRIAIFDYLIWNIVYKHGGIIMGLGSLTLKSHFDLLEDGKEMTAPRYSETNLWQFTMHGVIVRQHSKLAKLIIDDAELALNSPDMEGGGSASGNWLFIARALQNLDKVSIVPPGLCAHVKTSGSHVFEDDAIQHPDVRTIPLCGGSYLFNRTELDEKWIALSNSYYARVVKGRLSEEEWSHCFGTGSERAFPFFKPLTSPI